MDENEWRETCKTCVEEAYEQFVNWKLELEQPPSKEQIDMKWRGLSAAAEAEAKKLWPADFEKFGGFNCL